MIDEVYGDPRVRLWNIEEIMTLVRGRLKEGWTNEDVDNVISFKIKWKNWVQRSQNIESTSEAEKLRFGEDAKSFKEIPQVLKNIDFD